MVKFGPPKQAMAPPPVSCSSPGCQYSTPEGMEDFKLITEHLTMHVQLAHAAAAPPVPGPPASAKLDKRPRPEAKQDMSEHDFRFFESEWGRYKRAGGLQGQTLVDELWSCMSSDLKKLAFDQGDIDTLNTEDLMMKRIKSLAVAVLHTAVHTVHLHESKQLPDETCKTFTARVRGTASNCTLSKKCECGKDVSYLEETVYHVVLAGIRDRELQEACTTQALLGNIKDITTLVEFCTAKESGQLGTSGTVGGMKSSYQSRKFNQSNEHPAPAGPCIFCGASAGHTDRSRATREKECKAFTSTCSKCNKQGHYTRLCKTKPKVAAVEKDKKKVQDNDTDSKEASNGAVQYGFYGIQHGSWDFPPPASTPQAKHIPIPTHNRFSPLDTIERLPATDPDLPTTQATGRRATAEDTGTPKPPKPRFTRTGRRIRRGWSHKPRPIIAAQLQDAITMYEVDGVESHKAIPLCHMEYDPILGWQETPPRDSPTVKTCLRLHLDTYDAMSLPPPSTRQGKRAVSMKAVAIADTGAQMNILPLQELEKLMVDTTTLLPVRTAVSGATKGSRLNIIGGLFLSVKGLSPNSTETLQLFYAADNVRSTCLSLSALKALGIVSPDFPRISDTPQISGLAGNKCTNDGVVTPGQDPCSCPTRTLAPPDPTTGLSPAMIIFGRELRDHLPSVLSRYQPRKEWRMEADLREQAFAKRHCKMEERLNIGTKPLTEDPSPVQVPTPPEAQRGAPPGQPTAATHRQVPAAPPGHDVITQLKIKEAMGQILSMMLEYISPA